MNKKHEQEAIDIGLTLISEIPLNRNGVDDFNYKLYKFNNCTHEQYLQPTHVRRNNVRCNTCFEQNIVTIAKERGFTVLGACDDALFRLMKRDVCGHINKVRHGSLVRRLESTRDLDFTCEECHENRLIEDAQAADMTYLGAALARGGMFRHYKFNKCGHARDINSACITRGNFFCSECKEEKYAEDALAAGLIYKGFGSTKSECKRLYQLPCGHTKEIRMDHAKDGSYLCDKCGDSHYTKPSSIYLLKMQTPDGFSWLKLGFSKSLTIRKNNYGLVKGCKVDLLCAVDVATGAIAVSVEKGWHKLLKPLRLSKSLMKNYHRFNGFTECYSILAEGQILTLMDALMKSSNERTVCQVK